VALHIEQPNARLRLHSTLSTEWTVTEYQTDNRTWHTGVGGSAVPGDLQSTYYIADITAGAAVRLAITPTGTVGIVTTTPCAYAKLHVYLGNSGKGCFTAAIVGESGSRNGVRGVSDSGIAINASSGSGTGVYAESTSGDSVFGFSGSGTGVYGLSSSGTGVYGASLSGLYIFEGHDNGAGGDLRTGTILGKELESWDHGLGEIQVLVTLREPA
jgi:hypothetical protein